MNYQKELEKEIETIKEKNIRPKLLIHSCCGPCSTYVIEYLATYFDITIYYYNPNIYPKEEYYKRAKQQEELIDKMNLSNSVDFIEGDYIPKDYYKAVRNNYDDEEGSQRCFLCYELRLKKAAEFAKERGYDYFASTLSISPHKNAKILNQIGEKISKEYSIKHLPSDFKKKNGYKRSIEMSKEYGLYRQDYCGCIFSKK